MPVSRAQDSPRTDLASKMAKAPAIPRFFLYGDPPDEVELDFLHAERIQLRSGQHDWRIAAHAHPDHVQILLVEQGGGWMRVDGVDFPAHAPALMLIPAGMVHEIGFEPDTDGVVATIASAYLRDIARIDPALAAVVHRPMTQEFATDSAPLAEFSAAFEALLREFVWQAPGRRAAIAAQLQRILVGLLRVATPQTAEVGMARRNLDLVHRYRELIEHHFRQQHRIAFYAGQLHITVARLNAACQDVAGRSASNLLFDRLAIEAKRHLLYTNLGISEIAHSIGFEDAAYFSRFFTRRAGVPPSRFRGAP